jgi:hypothetical protein
MSSKNTADAEQQGADVPELVTPVEHAQTFEGIEPDEAVSDDSVPDDVEVAARSADMDSPSMTHEKVFVLGPSPLGGTSNPYTESRGYDHEPNKAATRQYAIDHGMWPTGEVAFKSAKRHPDGESWILTYVVPVIPAHVAEDDAQSPRVVADDGDAGGATNYLPPEDVEQHDDVTGDKPAA